MRLLIGAIAAVGAFSAASAESAAAPASGPTDLVDVNVYAPEGCPGTDELRKRLAARIGTGRLAPSRVVVTIEPAFDHARMLLEIQIIDAVGAMAEPRTLRGENCEELLSAAALILSIALVTEGEVADSTSPQTSIADAAERNRPFTRRAHPSIAPQQDAIIGRVGAVMAIDGGTLPSVASGAGVFLGVENGPLRIEIGGLYFPKRRTITDAITMSGGDLSSFTVSARACYGVGRVALCGGGEWALMLATGVGTDENSTRSFFLWGLTGAARWEVRLGERVVISTIGELVGRPRRPEFRISNPDRVVHRPSWLTVRGWLYGEVAVF